MKIEKKIKFELLQDLSSIEEYRYGDKIELPIRGWKNPEDWFVKKYLKVQNAKQK